MASNSQRLTPQDWDEWARNPVTDAWVASLQDTISEAKDRWAAGHFRGVDAEQTLRLTEQALVGVEMLQQVIDSVRDLKIVTKGDENA